MERGMEGRGIQFEDFKNMKLPTLTNSFNDRQRFA